MFRCIIIALLCCLAIPDRADEAKDETPVRVTLARSTIDDEIQLQHQTLSGNVNFVIVALKKDPRISYLPKAGRKELGSTGLVLKPHFTGKRNDRKFNMVISIESTERITLGSFTIRGLDWNTRKEVEEGTVQLIDTLLRINTEMRDSSNAEVGRLFEEYKSSADYRILCNVIALEPQNVTYRYEELKCLGNMTPGYPFSKHLAAINESLRKAIEFKRDFPDFAGPVFSSQVLNNTVRSGAKMTAQDLAGYAAYCDIWRPLYLQELRRREFSEFIVNAKWRNLNDITTYLGYMDLAYRYENYYDLDKWLRERYAANLDFLKRMNEYAAKKPESVAGSSFFRFKPTDPTVLNKIAQDGKKLTAYLSGTDEYLKLAQESPAYQFRKYALELKYMRKLADTPRTADQFEPVIKEYFAERGESLDNIDIWKYTKYLLSGNELELFEKRCFAEKSVQSVPAAAPKNENDFSKAGRIFTDGKKITPEAEALFQQANAGFDIQYRNYRELFRHFFNLNMIAACNQGNNICLVLQNEYPGSTSRVIRNGAAETMRVPAAIYLGFVKPELSKEKLIETPFKSNSRANFGYTVAASSDFVALSNDEVLAVYDVKNRSWNQFDDFIGNKVIRLAVTDGRIYLLEHAGADSTVKSMKADGTDRRLHYGSLREGDQNGIDKSAGTFYDLLAIGDHELIVAGISSIFCYDAVANRFQLLAELPDGRYRGMNFHRGSLYLGIQYINNISLYRIDPGKKSIEEILTNARNGRAKDAVPLLKNMFLREPYLVAGDLLWELGNSRVTSLEKPDDQRNIYLPMSNPVAFALGDGSVGYAVYSYLFIIKSKVIKK